MPRLLPGLSVSAALAVAAVTIPLPTAVADPPVSVVQAAGDAPPPCTPLPSSSTTTTADGATVYSYDLGGQTATTVVPSASINPLTATEQQLLANGYPPRPADTASAAYATWTQVVGNYHVATGDMCLSSSWAGATGGSNNITLTSWAGEISQDSRLQPYNEASGEFYQTGFRETCGNYIEGSTSWVGLGGTSNTNLAQAGTITDIVSGGGGLHMFWENWPTRAAVYFPGTIHPGDDIYADVFFSGGTSYFFVEDMTNGAVGNTAISFTPNRATAEFIDEAPQFTNSTGTHQAVLRHWYNGNVKWIQAAANSGTNVGADYHHNAFMHLTGSTGAENAGPDNGMVNNYTFYDYWHHCYNATT